jgi:hypothetical protein
MTAMALNRSQIDDPRKLRELLQKASSLVDYIGSALRVDDGIVRLTRDRAVFFLADANRARAEEVMDRLLIGFREKYTPAHEPRIGVAYFEVTPGRVGLTVRDVLPSIFAPAPAAH